MTPDFVLHSVYRQIDNRASTPSLLTRPPVKGKRFGTGRTEQGRGAVSVTLTLPTDSYPPGDYHIRLFNVSRGRQLLASYEVMLRTASARSR